MTTPEQPTYPQLFVTRGQMEGYLVALEESHARHFKSVHIDSDFPERLAATSDVDDRSCLIWEASAEVMRRYRADARILAARFGIPPEFAQVMDPN